MTPESEAKGTTMSEDKPSAPDRPSRPGLEGHTEVRTHGQRCGVCRELRDEGKNLEVSPDQEPVWVCTDCQQKLLRGVNDETVEGG